MSAFKCNRYVLYCTKGDELRATEFKVQTGQKDSFHYLVQTDRGAKPLVIQWGLGAIFRDKMAIA